MVEAKVWSYMKKWYVTVGPFENQDEAQKFEQGRPMLTPHKPKSKPKLAAEKELIELFPVLMKRAQNDPRLYDDLLNVQYHIRSERSEINRSQRPLYEILKNFTKAYRGGYLRANLTTPCLVCGEPVKAHQKRTLKHHLALLSNLMNRPKIKKLKFTPK